MKATTRPWGRLTAAAAVTALFLMGCATTQTPESQEITIKRDQYGTPHIYADKTYGLFYGMGYALAEDRLFQWEMLKRMGRGTAAEVLGKDYIESDKLARADYDPRAIQQQIEALPSQDRAILSGYVAGYNARLKEVLAQPETLLSKQFSDFGFMPTALTEVDVVGVYIRTIATNFSDANEEVANYALLTELRKKHGELKGQAIFDQLRWINDPKANTTINAADQIKQPEQSSSESLPWNNGLAPISQAALVKHKQLAAARHGADGPNTYPVASNLWIFNAHKTDINKAVFVNGPQYGNNSPGSPFGIALHGAGWDTVGASSWGLPLMNWGTNGDIAWGVTVGGGDTTDIFQLKTDPENQKKYEYKGQWLDFSERVETILVKDSEPVQLRFYHTKYGQVQVFDDENHTAYAKQRSWDGQEVSSLLAWLRMSQATNWEEFLAQGKKMALTMNWYYIDKEQNIGQAFLGHFPVKAPGVDPRLPTLGDGKHEWQGILDFSYLPKVHNPSSGYIVNWNNKPQPNWNNSDALFWGQVDRVDVADAYIQRYNKLSLAQINDLNRYASYQNIYVNYFRPYFAELLEQKSLSIGVKQAAQAVVDWQGEMQDSNQDGYYDSVGYAVFSAWLKQALLQAYDANVPEPFVSSLLQVNEARSSLGVVALLNALQAEEAGVPQKVNLLGTDRTSFMRLTLNKAVNALRQEQTGPMKDWRVTVRPHQFITQTFGGVPVNTASEAMKLAVQMNRGTSNHQVVFYPEGVEYLDVLPPGQSGFIAPNGNKSAHYEDQLELYGNFQYKQGWLSKEHVQQHQTSTKTLIIH